MRTLPIVFAWLAIPIWADTVVMKSGENVSGVVQRMDRGRVTVSINGQVRSIDVLLVDHIVFDTPHADEITAKGDMDAKQLAKLSQEARTARGESRLMLDAIKQRWQGKKEVDRADAQRWTAERERFSAPMAEYRAAIEDLYSSLAAQVEEYNKLAREANAVYVGVKGLMNTGSPLLPEDKKTLEPKQVLPTGWWDSIFYDGYSKGFKDAKEYDRLTPQ